jgi:hypothetical protein
LLSMFPMPLVCTFSPSSMPMICGFSLFKRSHTVRHIPLIFLHSFSYVFIYFVFQVLKFCLLLVQVCWSGFQLYILFDLRSILSSEFQFFEAFHFFIKFPFHTLYGLSYFIYLCFISSLNSFRCVFKSFLSSFICLLI